jgi:hypothetical protein
LNGTQVEDVLGTSVVSYVFSRNYDIDDSPGISCWRGMRALMSDSMTRNVYFIMSPLDVNGPGCYKQISSNSRLHGRYNGIGFRAENLSNCYIRLYEPDNDDHRECPRSCGELINSYDASSCKMEGGENGTTKTYGDYKCCCPDEGDDDDDDDEVIYSANFKCVDVRIVRDDSVLSFGDDDDDGDDDDE